VSVVGETKSEPHEAFQVTLSAPVSATLGRTVGQFTILNDDGRAALCRPIVAIPFTVTAQGNYCLVKNLSTSQTTGAAILVNSDFVNIDFKGFKIGGGGAGVGTQALGVSALNRKNITVRNGNIRGFLTGVDISDTNGSSQGHLIEHMLLDGNTYAGAQVKGSGMVLRSNQVVSIGGTTTLGPNANTYGIRSTGFGARLIDNDVTDVVGVGTAQGVAIAVDTGNGAVVERNRIGNSTLGVSWGVKITNSSSVLVLQNRLAVLQNGIDYQNPSTGRFRDNLTSGVSTPFTGGTDAGNNQ
jgi:hypothetical protein